MGLTLLIISAIVMLVTGIWLLVIGFQRSVLWGLAMIFIPFASLVFVIMYWHDAKKPFLISLAALPVYFVGMYMVAQENNLNPENITQVVEGIGSGEIKPNEAFQEYGKLNEEKEGTPGSTPDGAATAETTPSATESEIMAMADQDPANAKTGDADTATKPDEAAAEAADDKKPAQEKEDTTRFPSPGNIKPDPLVAKKKPAESPTIRIKLENIGSHKGRYFIITTKDGNQHRGLLNKVSDTTLYLSRKLYGGDFEYHVLKKKVERVEMLKEEYVKEFMEK